MITRINSLIKDKHLTERGFAIKCGVSQPTMHKFLAGISNPSYAVIMNILAANPDVSAEWLMRGDGNMYLSSNESEPVNRPITANTSNETASQKCLPEEFVKALLAEKDKQIEQLLNLLSK